MASLSWCTRRLPDLFSPVLGVIIGAVIVSYATWPWIFYATAIVALLVAIACTFLIPNPHRQNKYSQLEQFRRLDMAGSTLLIGKHCKSMEDMSYLYVQSCSGTLYLRGDVGIDRRMEDGHCLGSAYLVHPSFRFVLRLGSTSSRGLCLAVCT